MAINVSKTHWSIGRRTSVGVSKRIARLLLLLSLCGSLAACSSGGHDDPPAMPTISFAGEPGPHAVGMKTDVTMRDNTRDRNVTVTYWYQTEGQNVGPEQAVEDAALLAGNQHFPLMVLVHGIEDSAPGTWPYLAPHLASHGYIVVGPSTGSKLSNTADIVNHPGDISFLIDAVLGVNTSENMFLDRIDTEKIAIGGFSFGGLATYLVTYDPQYQDPRIKASIIMAGLSNETSPVKFNHSLFVMNGTEDPLIPYDSGLNIYEAAIAPKYFMTIRGGGHLGFTRNDNNDDGATMDQQRQETVTRLAVFAFLSSLFANTERGRQAAAEYLQTTFNQQNLDAEIIYEMPL